MTISSAFDARAVATISAAGMTPNPVTISPDASAAHAGFIMVEHRFGALPVVENGRTVGIVTETDVLRYFASDSMERKQRPESLQTVRSRQNRKAEV